MEGSSLTSEPYGVDTALPCACRGFDRCEVGRTTLRGDSECVIVFLALYAFGENKKQLTCVGCFFVYFPNDLSLCRLTFRHSRSLAVVKLGATRPTTAKLG